ncbi:MAG TPA: hypothetical protein VK823_01895 [Streptosporangiaceae bacterium]|jgi:hypothetical protein|nr:hypothetical protein [Streptosporangiaceae bacterium]
MQLSGTTTSPATARPQRAMVITGPAVNAGWYMYRFIYSRD